jgi:hypothetical protein
MIQSLFLILSLIIILIIKKIWSTKVNKIIFLSWENSNISNLKKKRRSKNDPNGRTFKCECGRGYLSALALSNHRKSKHESAEKLETNFLGKRRRGRPKKNVNFM